MLTSRLSSFFLSLLVLAGMSLLLYPTFSDYWNSFHSSKAIANYTQVVSDMDEETYERLLTEVYAYNASLLSRENPYLLNDEMEVQYDDLLNLDGSGIMGYVDIPSIGCNLPVYHTVEERVLQKAAGHIPWTSMPVGGASTHSVLSGHRGLPSARLFTDMDKVVVGDVFYLHILNETLQYEVDQIMIVDPRETDDLLIVREQDYCTLVTCTPYGVNTHRMLVRGHRVEMDEVNTVFVPSEAIQIEPIIVAPILSMPMLILLLIWLHIPKPQKVQIRGDSK